MYSLLLDKAIHLSHAPFLFAALVSQVKSTLTTSCCNLWNRTVVNGDNWPSCAHCIGCEALPLMSVRLCILIFVEPATTGPDGIAGCLLGVFR